MAAPQNHNLQDLAGLQQAQNLPAVPVPQAVPQAASLPVAVPQAAVPQAAAPALVAAPQADIQPQPVNNLNELDDLKKEVASLRQLQDSGSVDSSLRHFRELLSRPHAISTLEYLVDVSTAAAEVTCSTRGSGNLEGDSKSAKIMCTPPGFLVSKMQGAMPPLTGVVSSVADPHATIAAVRAT
ncbi:hypothetical protein QZH41_005609 [Actinostola sp. cb2023]|nr:hypothetical protein QZH41_005609 [Actinostola sp. cb2023]